MNRRIPNGTYGGVRGRGLGTPSYSIKLRAGLCSTKTGQDRASFYQIIGWIKEVEHVREDI